MASTQEMEAIARQKQAENQAQIIQNSYRDNQRVIWSKIIGLKLLDLVECEELGSGDDIVIQVFCDLKVRELSKGVKLIYQVCILEQHKARVWFSEGSYDGGLLDSEGEKLIPKLQRGEYTIY